ncbi:hypothetical protein D8B46_06035 [Candidatus Gracilibacteria bacterium]|nr:MAG: hypothetical protein D8B46_06035 [Candidatus Gracilibacteria bacterium]
MKKLLVIFMALCLSFAAVSCGKKETNNTTTGSTSTGTEQKADTSATTGGSCEKYIAYMECSYKAAKMDEATIKTTLEEAKKALTSEDACKAAIDQTKSGGVLVPGCSL